MEASWLILWKLDLICVSWLILPYSVEIGLDMCKLAHLDWFFMIGDDVLSVDSFFSLCCWVVHVEWTDVSIQQFFPHLVPLWFVYCWYILFNAGGFLDYCHVWIKCLRIVLVLECINLEWALIWFHVLKSLRYKYDSLSQRIWHWTGVETSGKTSTFQA